MLGKGKHGEQKKKTQNQHQQHNKKCVCVCANEFFLRLLITHTHSQTHTRSLTTHVFVLSCHYVTTDTRFIIICRPVCLCAGVRVCLCLCVCVCAALSIKIHLLSIFRNTLGIWNDYTHSNLLSKLNLRLADQFNNMNHMERFALERCAFARKFTISGYLRPAYWYFLGLSFSQFNSYCFSFFCFFGLFSLFCLFFNLLKFLFYTFAIELLAIFLGHI